MITQEDEATEAVQESIALLQSKLLLHPVADPLTSEISEPLSRKPKKKVSLVGTALLDVLELTHRGGGGGGGGNFAVPGRNLQERRTTTTTVMCKEKV
jgi:hypothetical protein